MHNDFIMNKTRIIEIGFLALIGIGNFIPLFDPSDYELDTNPAQMGGWLNTLTMSLITIVFVTGMFYSLISGKVKNPKAVIKSPKLGNNPFNFNAPLEGLFFISLFFFVAGSAMNITSLIQYLELSQPGIIAIAYGIGLLGTIKLALKKRRTI